MQNGVGSYEQVWKWRSPSARHHHDDSIIAHGRWTRHRQASAARRRPQLQLLARRSPRRGTAARTCASSANSRATGAGTARGWGAADRPQTAVVETAASLRQGQAARPSRARFPHTVVGTAASLREGHAARPSRARFRHTVVGTAASLRQGQAARPSRARFPHTVVGTAASLWQGQAARPSRARFPRTAAKMCVSGASSRGTGAATARGWGPEQPQRPAVGPVARVATHQCGRRCRRRAPGTSASGELTDGQTTGRCHVRHCRLACRSA